MVDCSRFLEEYSDFRDGLLPPDRSPAFQAHLAACEACARYDRVVEQGAGLARDLPDVEPSYDFMARLQHRIYHVDAERSRDRRSRSDVPVASTLAIAGVIAASAWLPAMRPEPAVVELPPVAAHAPHRVEAVDGLFGPGPFVAAGDPAYGGAAYAGNLLFYRYTPVGSFVARPASLVWPH